MGICHLQSPQRCSCNQSDACGISSHTNSEMLERQVKEIAEKYVDLSSADKEWKDLHLADPALKFKVFPISLKAQPVFLRL